MTGRRLLLLLRHAKAVADTGPGGATDDHARDLSERGLREAGALGRVLQEMRLQPELALVSSALRTRRTWEMLGPLEAPAPAVVVTDRLYLATPRELRGALREVEEPVGSVMLVGHNPGLHELALQLTSGERSAAAVELRAGLPTCTLVMIEIEGGWDRLQPSASTPARLVRP